VAREEPVSRKVDKSEDQWRQDLTSEEYSVLRGKGTEPAFTGSLWDCKEDGVYRCAGCSTALFRSNGKFDSGTGWPSFWEPICGEAVEEAADASHGMLRTEVLCAACGGHLGHVFPDGPEPTGQRYCINSASLTLDVDADPEDSSQG
jgi:peptide-methionine (R)-S-oxide reductase